MRSVTKPSAPRSTRRCGATAIAPRSSTSCVALRGCPGPRLNLGLVRAFASEAARRGGDVDALLASMLALHEDVAPYGHVDEVLPILGAAAIGQRAAEDAEGTPRLDGDARRGRLRSIAGFRVREAVARALVNHRARGRLLVRGRPPALGRRRSALARAGRRDRARRRRSARDHRRRRGVRRDRGALLDRLDREHRAGRRHDAFRRLFKGLETTTPIVGHALPAGDRHAAEAGRQVATRTCAPCSRRLGALAALAKGRFSRQGPSSRMRSSNPPISRGRAPSIISRVIECARIGFSHRLTGSWGFSRAATNRGAGATRLRI